MYANINVERKSQKALLLVSGRLLKEINESETRYIQQLLGNKVYSELWVKAEKDWRKRKRPQGNTDIEQTIEIRMESNGLLSLFWMELSLMRQAYREKDMLINFDERPRKVNVLLRNAQ